MGADLHIHVITDDITDEDLKCFFSHTIGHPLGIIGEDIFSVYDCDETKKKNENLHLKSEQLKKEFPEYTRKGTMFDYSKEIQTRWGELLREHYKEAGHTCSHHEKISNTPNIWVGEVSWLKAALYDDSETFVPSPIAKVSEIIDEKNKGKALVTDEFIDDIRKALTLSNITGYTISNAKDVVKFLKKYRGKYVFTISW